MRLSLPISVSLLLAWQAACAQTADDFFNGGAHFYISNNIPQALAPVEEGLKQYPDDVKLKKLYELLKQQQQSQNSQSQQNQQNQSQQQKSNSQQHQQQQKQHVPAEFAAAKTERTETNPARKTTSSKNREQPAKVR